MKDKKRITLQVTTYILSGLIVLTGIFFLVQLIRIYSGDSTPIYSREIVGQHLLELLPLLIVTILLVIFVGVFSTLYGVAKKEKIHLTYQQRYKAMSNNLGVIDSNEFKKEKTLRLVLKIVNYVIFGICLFFCLFYILTNNHFDPLKDATEQVINALVHFAPWLLISLVSSVVTMIISEKSYKRSIEIITQNKSSLLKLETKKQKAAVLWSIRGVIFAIAIFCIVYGAINGDAADVLLKAKNICTECIGLG